MVCNAYALVFGGEIWVALGWWWWWLLLVGYLVPLNEYCRFIASSLLLPLLLVDSLYTLHTQARGRSHDCTREAASGSVFTSKKLHPHTHTHSWRAFAAGGEGQER